MYKRVTLPGAACTSKPKDKKGEIVPVKLEKEPSNPYDCNAIAFMCHAEKDWERIGYVVSKALTDTNEAISNNKILKVYFSWIKYIRIAGNFRKVKFSKNLRESDFKKNIFENLPTLPAE